MNMKNPLLWFSSELPKILQIFYKDFKVQELSSSMLKEALQDSLSLGMSY